MLAHRADVAVDGHTVVVEDNDQRLAGRAGVVESLIGKAAGERAVADEGKHAVILCSIVRARAMPSATETELEA